MREGRRGSDFAGKAVHKAARTKKETKGTNNGTQGGWQADQKARRPEALNAVPPARSRAVVMPSPTSATVATERFRAVAPPLPITAQSLDGSHTRRD